MSAIRRLIAIGVLVALAACGGGQTPIAEPTDTPSPAPTTEPASEPATEPARPSPQDTEPVIQGVSEATAFFVRSDDSGIWVEPETRELDAPTLGVAGAAIRLLVEGRTTDPNLTTLAPEGTEILGVDIAARVLVVDLSGAVRDAGGSSSQEIGFAQQLAHTGAQFDTVDAVRLRIDGADITELWGHLDWSEPIEPDPFALAPVDIVTPEWGAEVRAGEVTVSGEANTFEATVELRLVAPDTSVVEDTFTTATSGSGERGTWEHTFTIDEPGRWSVEAVEPDPSDGEGRPPFSVWLEIEVS
jgi:hypothetical protein